MEICQLNHLNWSTFLEDFCSQYWINLKWFIFWIEKNTTKFKLKKMKKISYVLLLQNSTLCCWLKSKRIKCDRNTCLFQCLFVQIVFNHCVTAKVFKCFRFFFLYCLYSRSFFFSRSFKMVYWFWWISTFNYEIFSKVSNILYSLELISRLQFWTYGERSQYEQ